MRPRPLTLRLRAQNDAAKGLGLALPAGMASVIETVAGQRLLVGEAKIGDKAKGERVDYDIGSSPAVQVRVRILHASDAKDSRRGGVMNSADRRVGTASMIHGGT